MLNKLELFIEIILLVKFHVLIIIHITATSVSFLQTDATFPNSGKFLKTLYKDIII
jgi:uncharacterized integral membrane protein